jgi:hypothetical protein
VPVSRLVRVARWLVLLAFVAIGIWQAFWHHHDPPNPLVWIGLLVLAMTAALLNGIIRGR